MFSSMENPILPQAPPRILSPDNQFQIGESVKTILGRVTITGIQDVDVYTITVPGTVIEATFTADQLIEMEQQLPGVYMFKNNLPETLIIDNFLENPDLVHDIARSATYVEDLRHYKGKRTTTRYLYGGLKEKFEQIFSGVANQNMEIYDWLNQPMNGVFQQTQGSDPLVYHADSQDFAAAIYLTQNPDLNTGTSFWRHKGTGVFRVTDVPFERINQEVITSETITNGEHWELVSKVGNVYNRLAIWNAKLIHSASSYDPFSGDDQNTRLIQLFFFSVRPRSV